MQYYLCLKNIPVETELSKMSWNSNIEVHCMTNGYPYSTASFMEYFEGLTYDHVNFIFSGPSHSQVLNISLILDGFLGSLVCELD